MPYKRVPIYGTFSSADASALSEPNARIPLFVTNNPAPVALVLGAEDYVEITDINTCFGALGTATVYDGPDNVVDAGDIIMRTRHATTLVNAQAVLQTPHRCRNGSYPKVLSITGQIDVTVHGYVYVKIT